MDEIQNALKGLGVNGMQSAVAALDTDPSKYINNTDLEEKWAAKAFKHAETYFKLITSFDPRKLKLTKCDDDIYDLFTICFKGFQVDNIDEDSLKSEESKARWRPFCENFKGKIQEYNFGTLLRKSASSDYSPENTLLVTKIQFISIEIVRNRHGYNDCHRKNAKDEER